MNDYKITNEGLDALVTGKLKVERDVRDDSVSPRNFKVAYDSMVISQRKVQFVYENHAFMELELPIVGAHDTITVTNLEGKISLIMSL